MRFLIFFLLAFSSLFSQSRKDLNFPNIEGFVTLKCDFHIHTIFSDGTVWPTDRVTEAWMEGLDAIAITDHIEYKPFKNDVNPDHNRPYEIALKEAQKRNIILIKAAEITRSMPPGHLNAYFVKDINKLEKQKFEDVVEEVKTQGGFLIWNHPGWKAQQPDTTKWFEIHTKLLQSGILKGIEVVNYGEYYPIVFKWAIEKNLCIFGNSDIHGPISFVYDKEKKEHRPVTLVFAKDKSEQSIRTAIENNQTAVWNHDTILGFEKWVKPLFISSVETTKIHFLAEDRKSGYFNIKNKSDNTIKLKLIKISASETKLPETIEIPPLTTVMVKFSCKNPFDKNMQINAEYSVLNWLTGPDSNLTFELIFDIP